MKEEEQSPLIQSVKSPSRRNEIFAVVGVTLALFATGNMAGFSAIALPSFIEPSAEIKATHDELSLITSMAYVGSFVGNIMGGLLANQFGRKKSIIVSSLLFFCGWIVIAEARTVLVILLGRVLTGWAAGLCSSPVQVYIGEVASSATRGASGAAPSLTVTLGMLCIFTLGSLLQWRTVAFASSAIPIIVILYVTFLPESPTWLVARGRYQEALKNLHWLRRGQSQECQKEFDILKSLKERRDEEKNTQITSGPLVTTSRNSSCPHLTRYFEWRVLKPFLIGTSLILLQSFGGIYPITGYTTLIFMYSGRLLNPYLETVIVGSGRIVGVIGIIFLINSFPKRKPLLIVSGLVTSIANGVLGGYFYYKEVILGASKEGAGGLNFTAEVSSFVLSSGGMNETSVGVKVGSLGEVTLEWVPLVCILVFLLGYSVGFGIVPWFLIVELLPADVRSVYVSVGFALGQIFLFTAMKTFLDVVDLIGAHGAFWSFSCISLVSVLFVARVLPETANLNDKQIEEIFAGRKRKTGDEKC